MKGSWSWRDSRCVVGASVLPPPRKKLIPESLISLCLRLRRVLVTVVHLPRRLRAPIKNKRKKQQVCVLDDPDSSWVTLIEFHEHGRVCRVGIGVTAQLWTTGHSLTDLLLDFLLPTLQLINIVVSALTDARSSVYAVSCSPYSRRFPLSFRMIGPSHLAAAAYNNLQH